MADFIDFERCRAAVAEFMGTQPEQLQRSTHLYNDLGIDSLGMFSLGMHLIRTFKVKVPLSEVAQISTLGDIYDAITRHA